MKRIYLVLTLSFMTFMLYAQELFFVKNDFNLSLGVSLGIVSGQAEEVVYAGSRSETKLSQLLWNMDTLIYTGLELSSTWKNPKNWWGLFSDLSVKRGFPGETGVIEDRDWTIANYPEWLTHYSVHTNNTDSAIQIDAAIGMSFSVFDDFLLKTFLAYNYMTFSWTASGGSFLYPRNPDPNAIEHGYLTNPIDVGTYEQTWNIISPGIALYGAFNQYFDIEISLKVSPFIWCAAVDNHVLRKLVITDDMSGGLFIEPKLVFSYTPPNDTFILSLTVNYKNISSTRGDAIYDYQGEPTFTYSDGRGAAYHSFDIGLTGKFKIF